MSLPIPVRARTAEERELWRQLLTDPIKTITAADSPYTVVDGDATLLVDATAGAVTVRLPAVARWEGRGLVVKKIDASANAVTVDGDGSEVIDGAATLAMTVRWRSYAILSNGTAWYVRLSFDPGPTFSPSAHATSHAPGGADPMAVDALAAVGSLRTLGTGGQQACAGNDGRLSDARTPTSHASTHRGNGADAIPEQTFSGTINNGATQTVFDIAGSPSGALWKVYIMTSDGATASLGEGLVGSRAGGASLDFLPITSFGGSWTTSGTTVRWTNSIGSNANFVAKVLRIV